MSFGYSVGDCVLLVQLAYRTVQNARRACGAHDALSREVTSLHVVLQRVESEVRKPESLLNRAGNGDTKELDKLLTGCKAVLNTVSQILEKYNALSAEKRSVTKLWQKVRFGNGEMLDLATIRGQIATYTQAITLFLNLLSMTSQGKVEAYMESQGKELREIKSSLNFAIAKLDSRNPDDKSVLTTYAGDDKAVWREFRRELIQEGYSYRDLMRHKKTIQAYIWELAQRGILDDNDPQQQEQDEGVAISAQAEDISRGPDEDGIIAHPTTLDREPFSRLPVENSNSTEDRRPHQTDTQVLEIPLQYENIQKTSPEQNSYLAPDDKDSAEYSETVDSNDDANISRHSSDEPDLAPQSNRYTAPYDRPNHDDKTQTSETYVSKLKLEPTEPRPQPPIPTTAIELIYFDGGSHRKKYQAYVEDDPDDETAPRAQPQVSNTTSAKDPTLLHRDSTYMEQQASSRHIGRTPRSDWHSLTVNRTNRTPSPTEAWSSDSEPDEMPNSAKEAHKKSIDAAKIFEDKLKEVPCDPGLTARKGPALIAVWGSASEGEQPRRHKKWVPTLQDSESESEWDGHFEYNDEYNDSRQKLWNDRLSRQSLERRMRAIWGSESDSESRRRRSTVWVEGITHGSQGDSASDMERDTPRY